MLKTIIASVTVVTAIIGLLVGLVKLRRECGDRDFVSCGEYVLSGLPTASPAPSAGSTSPTASTRPATPPTVPQPLPPATAAGRDRLPSGVLAPQPDARKPDRLCVFLGARMECTDPKP